MLTGMAAWRENVLQAYHNKPALSESRSKWSQRIKSRRRSAIAKASRKRNRR